MAGKERKDYDLGKEKEEHNHETCVGSKTD